MNIDRFTLDFELSAPFCPIEQLMAVLPSDSANALPEPFRPLMLEKDSEIADFYPTDVPVDPNGKAMPWLWVLLLPFIDEQRLVEIVAPIIETLNPEDAARNELGGSYIFLHSSHPLAERVLVSCCGWCCG